jgi:hypothetical protein
MGATTLRRTLAGTLTPEQVTAEFRRWQEEDRREHGTDAYNGTWSTIHGLMFRGTSATVHDLTDDDPADDLEKREAVALRCRITKRVLTKIPTFGGKPPTTTLEHHAYEVNHRGVLATAGLGLLPAILPADGLSVTARTRLARLVEASNRTARWLADARTALNVIIAGITKPDYDLVCADLKKARSAFFVAQGAKAKADAKLKTYDDKLVAQLWAETIEEEIQWVVVGVAAC